MKTSFEQYKAEKKDYLYPFHHAAKSALQSLKSKQRFEVWKESIGAKSFYTDCDNIAHGFEREGIRYVFKADYDDYPFHDDIKHQGYEIEYREARFASKPDFAEHGEFTRWKRGEGFEFCIGFSPAF